MLSKKKPSVLVFTILSLIILPVHNVMGASFSLFGKPVVDIVNDLIELILSYLGKISLLVLIIGGVLYVVSGSNQEAQEKARKTITYALFGIILVLISYATLAILHRIVVQL